jgi:hypothetical protein
MKTKIVRPSILMAGIFVLGFLCGSVWSSIYDRGVEVEVNLVRLKCLYSLAEDYNKETGRWPGKWDELKSWCNQTPCRKTMFRGASGAYSMGRNRYEWRLVVDGGGEFAGFQSVSYSSLHHHYHMKSDGSVSVVKKEE